MESASNTLGTEDHWNDTRKDMKIFFSMKSKFNNWKGQTYDPWIHQHSKFVCNYSEHENASLTYGSSHLSTISRVSWSRVFLARFPVLSRFVHIMLSVQSICYCSVNFQIVLLFCPDLSSEMPCADVGIPKYTVNILLEETNAWGKIFQPWFQPRLFKFRLPK